MKKLYPSKHITKPEEGFSGFVFIDGDLDDNCIMYSFLFDEEAFVHPLLIWVRVTPLVTLRGYFKRHNRQNAKIYVYEANIPDISNPVMKTALIYPDFSLRGHKIKVINIESQIGVEWHPHG
jgi:hypothetical protein